MHQENHEMLQRSFQSLLFVVVVDVSGVTTGSAAAAAG